VLGEGASAAAGGALEFVSFLADDNLAGGALRNLVSPPTPVGILVEGEAGRTLVAVGLSIDTFPEDSTVLLIREGSMEVGTVPCGDGRFQLKPVSTLHEVQLGALFQVVRRIRIHEGQAIAA
jgi:hypothetical protein